MPHSRTTEILRTASQIFDRDRLVAVHEAIKSRIGDYGADLFRPTAMTEIRVGGDAIGGGLDLGTLAEAIYRVDHHSFKCEYLLKGPAVWLLQSLWWVMHPTLGSEWLDLKYAMEMWRPHAHEGLYPSDLLGMVDALFRKHTTAHDVLTTHLSAGYESEDWMRLLAGVPWAVGHLSWPSVVLHYAEHLDEAGQGHVSMPEGMASYLLADLREEWLPGPWHEFDAMMERIAKAREEERSRKQERDEQGAEGADEDGGQGEDG